MLLLVTLWWACLAGVPNCHIKTTRITTIPVVKNLTGLGTLYWVADFSIAGSGGISLPDD